jgi:hypothetical protein
MAYTSLAGKFIMQRKWATTGFHGSNKQSYKISLLVGWFYDLQKEEEKFGLAGKRSQTLIICWLFVWLMETKLIFWSLIIKDWTWKKYFMSSTPGFQDSSKQSLKISLSMGWFFDFQKEEEKFGPAAMRSQTLIVHWLFVQLMEIKLIFWSFIIKDWTWNKKSWIIFLVQKIVSLSNSCSTVV